MEELFLMFDKENIKSRRRSDYCYINASKNQKKLVEIDCSFYEKDLLDYHSCARDCVKIRIKKFIVRLSLTNPDRSKKFSRFQSPFVKLRVTKGEFSHSLARKNPEKDYYRPYFCIFRLSNPLFATHLSTI